MKPERVPSPATIISCIALFLALGGTGYAATEIAATHSGAGAPTAVASKAKRKASQKALIKAAVARYLTAHKAEFVGSRGPAGDIGPRGEVGLTGASGESGPRGEVGPAGLASVSDALSGPVSTGSAAPVDLGGPSVTVNVGPSGLVAFWATAKLKSVGGGTAKVWLISNSFAPQIESSSSSPITFYTQPGSNSGTIIFNSGLSTNYVGPGTKTISLQYSDSAGTGVFEGVRLVVIPL